ncbi:hypothetical protein OG21DRAFT_782160 [Imleria badia]|nr:hypothetical protein OG21DRAFT_782160 [Imleria badia]
MRSIFFHNCLTGHTSDYTISSSLFTLIPFVTFTSNWVRPSQFLVCVTPSSTFPQLSTSTLADFGVHRSYAVICVISAPRVSIQFGPFLRSLFDVQCDTGICNPFDSLGGRILSLTNNLGEHSILSFSSLPNHFTPNPFGYQCKMLRSLVGME